MIQSEMTEKKMNMPCSEAAVRQAEAAGLELVSGEDGLMLCGNGLSMRGDFTHMIPRLRKDRLAGEMLCRAAKLKHGPEHPTLLDATAGLGEDSLLLAAAGFDVTLYEYNPVIAALLRDALRRAEDVPELREIAARMHLEEGDSIAAMRALTEPKDVILLDPMFPERQKSALIKKKFQLLQKLECPCTDEEELLQAAIAAAPRKIVIKRPLKGPFLAGRKPDYSMVGKAIRYDCLVFARSFLYSLQ